MEGGSESGQRVDVISADAESSWRNQVTPALPNEARDGRIWKAGRGAWRERSRLAAIVGVGIEMVVRSDIAVDGHRVVVFVPEVTGETAITVVYDAVEDRPQWEDGRGQACVIDRSRADAYPLWLRDAALAAIRQYPERANDRCGFLNSAHAHSPEGQQLFDTGRAHVARTIGLKQSQ